MSELTWVNRIVQETEVTDFAMVRDIIPTFTQEEFKLPNQEGNQYMDVIVKEPLHDDDSRIPLVTVSKNYSLVQHHEVIDKVEESLQKINCVLSETNSSLKLTEYGERMWLSMRFPDVMSFDPGDGKELQLQAHVINSVDGSVALTFEMGWYREICTNGLFKLARGNAIKRKHTKLIDKDIQKFFENFKEIEEETETYQLWYDKTIDIEDEVLCDWIDNTVKHKWGTWMAARAYHAIETAKDGRVDLSDAMSSEEKRLHPHTIGIIPEIDIPGSRPAENMLDVVHAMSYLASHERNISTRYNHMQSLPGIIKELDSRI